MTVELTCGKPACPEHRYCAYHGTEIGRCPWCHVEWENIVRGSHTCEQAKTWPSKERKWRVLAAEQARHEAHQQRMPVESEPHCPHMEVGAN